MKRHKAFTLIELLVVIAIISLLLAILIPALTAVRKHSKAVLCRHRLGQWGKFLSMYTKTNDGILPEWRWFGAWYKPDEALIKLHFERPKLALCPMATKIDAPQPFKAYIFGDPGHGIPDTKRSYGINVYAASTYPMRGKSLWYLIDEEASDAVIGPRQFWQTDVVKGADRIPVFGDCIGVCGWSDNHDSPPPKRDTPHWIETDEPGYKFKTLRRGISNFCVDRHNCGINMLFMDWSARKVGLQELWYLKWHRFSIERKGFRGEWPLWIKRCKGFDPQK